jgi:hypothetical protein
MNIYINLKSPKFNQHKLNYTVDNLKLHHKVNTTFELITDSHPLKN